MRRFYKNRAFLIGIMAVLSLFAFAKRDKVLQIFRNGEVIQEYNVADIDYIEVNDLIEAPEEINASVGENQITIKWSAVDGATYNVYRSPDNVEFTLIASELTQTIYTDSQPLSGSNFYRVKAVVNGVERDYTSSVAATLPSNPPIYGELSESTMEIFNRHLDNMILIQVDDKVRAEIKKRNIEYLDLDWKEDEDCNFWIWEETYIPNETTSPGIDGGYDYLSLTVGNKGWSGCGFSISEGKDFSMINDNTRIHFAYRSNSEPAVKSQCVILLDGGTYDAGARSAEFSLGEPFEDVSVFYPSIAPAPNKNWQVVDISIGELKRVCPDFNLGDLSKPWTGNIFSLLSGSLTGANIEIDACFLYNPPLAAPLYITGAGDFVKGEWNPETPDRFRVEDGWYEYNVNNLSKFRLSTACGDWDLFNDGSLGCNYGYTPDVEVALESPFFNIECPWVGNYVIKVSLDLSTIILSTTTPNPTPTWNTPLYLRRDMNSWGSDEAWELENLGNGIFRFVCSDEQCIREGETFKVTDAYWDKFNIGTQDNTPIYLNIEQQVYNNSKINNANTYLESDFNGVLWLMLKDAGGDRDVIVLSNDKSFVPSWAE